MRAWLRLLTCGAALAAAGCTCSSTTTIGGGGGDGGFRDGGFSIAPKTASVDFTTGQPPPTVQFSATAQGQPVTASWQVSPAAIATVDGAGLFTATGAAAGEATVTATFGGATDQAKVTVRLRLAQNGGLDGGAAGTGLGGVGGVGGEGVGGPVPPALLPVLQGAPSVDPGLTLLYPYDGTVWPRGILAPLLQWAGGAQAYEAVAIHLECAAISWDGTFAKTATPFIHHPIPQLAWQQVTEACAGQAVTLRVVLASAGGAWGPLAASWKVASGSLKGVVYYNSYGSKLALNYSGALPGNGPFGGATLAVRGSSTDPELVAGRSGGVAECRVCHVVSADGSTLLSQHGDAYGTTSRYALKSGNTETPMLPGDGRFGWGGLSPDGTLLFSNAATPMAGGSGAASALFQVPAGTEVPTTGVPAGLRAGTPVFAPGGNALAFNWFGGAAAGGAGDQRTLAMMRFTAPGAFSDFTALFTPPAGQTALYPSFLPSGAAVVFELETQSNGRGFGETRSSCDSSGGCSETGARGELWWVDVATRQARRLDRANGTGTIPTGPAGHGDDATLNYEPTVGPIGSGGYAWVIFTSRRLYGNVATINPYWSDPRFHDLSSSPTPKKLWVAAIDLQAPAGVDPSHPAFYLPAQELLAGNSRGYWSLDPCRADGEGCGSGDQCCGGYCRGPTEATTVCGSSNGGGCANEFERCAASAECCGQAQGAYCENARCVVPALR